MPKHKRSRGKDNNNNDRNNNNKDKKKKPRLIKSGQPKILSVLKTQTLSHFFKYHKVKTDLHKHMNILYIYIDKIIYFILSSFISGRPERRRNRPRRFETSYYSLFSYFRWPWFYKPKSLLLVSRCSLLIFFLQL